MAACIHAAMNTTRTSTDTQISPTPKKEPLQLRLPVQVKREFKAHAAIRGLEPNELFVEVWEYYARAHEGTKAQRDGFLR